MKSCKLGTKRSVLMKRSKSFDNLRAPTSGDQYTLLYLALQNDDLEVCKMLLRKYNKMKAQGPNQLTPLHLAVEKGFVEVVGMILQQFYPYFSVLRNDDELIESAFELAKQKGNLEMIQLFKDIIEKRLEFIYNNWDIADVVTRGYPEEKILQFFHKFLEMKKSTATDLLLIATEHELLTCVKEAIRYGADVNFKLKDGNCCLHLAVYHNDDVDILKFLLENGADVDNEDNLGDTALDIAFILNRKEFIDLFLDFDCNILRKGFNGENLFTKILSSIELENRFCHTSDSYLNYIYKRRFANLNVDIELCETADANKKSAEVVRNILSEIELMKRKQIPGTTKTFYDFFISLNNISKLVQYTGNPEVDKAFGSFDCDFPIYSNVFRNSLMKAKQRKLMLNELYSISNRINVINLPIVCVDLLASYLGNADLKNLVGAYRT